MNRTTGPEAWTNLFRSYYSYIFRFFQNRGFSAAESEDLAQETFVNAFRGLHTFRGDASFGTWLVRVATNVWRNELRRRSTVKRFAVEVPLQRTVDKEAGEEETPVEADAKEASPLDTVIESERRQILLEAFESLPSQMRRCIYLRVTQDLKYQEVADAMQLSIQTVRSQLHQARQRLKEKLEPYFSDFEI